jgi:hypothetical protein
MGSHAPGRGRVGGGANIDWRAILCAAQQALSLRFVALPNRKTVAALLEAL